MCLLKDRSIKKKCLWMGTMPTKIENSKLICGTYSSSCKGWVDNGPNIVPIENKTTTSAMAILILDSTRIRQQIKLETLGQYLFNSSSFHLSLPAFCHVPRQQIVSHHDLLKNKILIDCKYTKHNTK